MNFTFEDLFILDHAIFYLFCRVQDKNEIKNNKMNLAQDVNFISIKGLHEEINEPLFLIKLKNLSDMVSDRFLISVVYTLI